MDFVKSAMNKGSSGGGSSELGGLGQLSQVFGHAESQSGSGAGASDIMSAFNKFSGGGHKDTASAAKATGGSGALDKLIDMHSAATGKSKIDLSNGLDASDVMGMTQLAEKHGIKVPPGVMKKMLEYKLKGMI